MFATNEKYWITWRWRPSTTETFVLSFVVCPIRNECKYSSSMERANVHVTNGRDETWRDESLMCRWISVWKWHNLISTKWILTSRLRQSFPVLQSDQTSITFCLAEDHTRFTGVHLRLLPCICSQNYLWDHLWLCADSHLPSCACVRIRSNNNYSRNVRCAHTDCNNREYGSFFSLGRDKINSTKQRKCCGSIFSHSTTMKTIVSCKCICNRRVSFEKLLIKMNANLNAIRASNRPRDASKCASTMHSSQQSSRRFVRCVRVISCALLSLTKTDKMTRIYLIMRIEFHSDFHSDRVAVGRQKSRKMSEPNRNMCSSAVEWSSHSDNHSNRISIDEIRFRNQTNNKRAIFLLLFSLSIHFYFVVLSVVEKVCSIEQGEKSLTSEFSSFRRCLIKLP